MTASRDTHAFARRIRRAVLRMTHKANASHVGTSFSMADLLAVLYGGGLLRVDPSRPDWDDRDRFVLSKGHGAAGLYAALAEAGFFPKAWLDHYCEDGSPLAGHIHHEVPGVEVSTGSLGHGLSIACGMALAGKADGRAHRVFGLLSDGECDEGSTWEAALFAPHHRLDNLVAIVDHNKIQSFGTVKDVLDLDPFAAKWSAFGWAVREVDGHDHEALRLTLEELPFEPGRPSVLIAHTTKGKGVGFMEDRLLWHYRSVNAEQLAEALEEVGGDD
jgi:transketolase